MRNWFIGEFNYYRSKILRLYLSKKYISGNGLEIGALHKPLRVFNGAHVLYVDRKPLNDLRDEFTELKDWSLVDVDVIDDGEHLNTIPDNSVDFVIANHFLEHCEDPIRTIKTFVRVLRRDGFLFLAVPDKRYTFDKDRNLTSLEHLTRDHFVGPIVSREDHFKDFEEHVTGKPVSRDYKIHFHVWTGNEVRELLAYVEGGIRLDISTIKCVNAGVEHIFVVKKL
jgi:SAM-dependent methyltransferase